MNNPVDHWEVRVNSRGEINFNFDGDIEHDLTADQAKELAAELSIMANCAKKLETPK